MKKLFLLAGALLPVAGARSGRRQAQGLLHLCRPGWRFRLVPPARSGPPGAGERSRRQGRDHLSRECQRRSRRRPRYRAAGARRLRPDLHHLLRLHGCDGEGRQKLSRREVRARHRLQDAPPILRPTTPASMKAATSSARSRPACRRPASPAMSCHSRSPKWCMGINSFMLGAQSVNPSFKVKIIWVTQLVRSGQGGRCRQGAGRPGRRHHRAAHRLDGAAADRRGAPHPRLRPGLGHDQICPPCPADRHHRSTGAPITSSRAKAVLDGTWKSTDTWDGIDGGDV